jgi:hypothetical protein
MNSVDEKEYVKEQLIPRCFWGPELIIPYTLFGAVMAVVSRERGPPI